MSQKKKASLSKIHTGMNSSSKQVLSSTSSANEKTEDDVGDEMDFSLQCDACKKLIIGLNNLDRFDCGHFYCLVCSPLQPKENHSSCATSTSPSNAFTREVSPQQIAEHTGELSNNGAERGKIRGSTRATRKGSVNKSKSGRTRRHKKVPDQRLWYFLYLSKPVVVSLPTDATYHDLMARLYTLLGVSGKTHMITLRTQKSSSEEGEGEFSGRGDPAPLEVGDSKTRLSDLKITRHKMLLLDVDDQKKDGSGEEKKEKKSAEKEKKISHENVQSLSPSSRAEDPRSS